MDYRYSDLTVEQLRAEARQFKEKAQKAEQLGDLSEVAVNERKMQVAIAYMLNPADYEAQTIYKMNGDPGHTFKVDYINGVFAWGHRVNLLGELYEKQEAVPISILGDVVKKTETD